MASPKKPSVKNKQKVTSKVADKQPSPGASWRRNLSKIVGGVRRRIDGLLLRRPHRSFRRTRRRDAARTLTMPGYWAFTNDVRRMLTRNKKLFLGLVLFYGILTVSLVGLSSQDTYTVLGETLRETGDTIFQGNVGEIGKATLLLVAGLTGGFSAPLGTVQQVYAVIVILLTWLSTVWLLRALMTGGKPRLRDGLYSAGSPIMSTFIVALVVVVQLLPVAFAAAGFGAALASGVLDGGIEAMLFWVAASLLVMLSLYWITSTFIALVVVTLPGMYPMNAIKIAGDLVIGRRLRILLRMMWLFFTIALLWIVILVPIILLDAWLKGVWPVIAWLPIVPVCMLVMTSFTVVWAASYIYLFYRKVVDDDAAPA